MKIIKVKKCEDCFFLTYTPYQNGNDNTKYTSKYFCKLLKIKNHLGKYIGIKDDDCEVIDIPEWCPLEDYDERDTYTKSN